MRQATPQPPATSKSSGLGEAIQTIVEQSVNGALTQARAEIDAQLAAAKAERSALQNQYADMPAGAARQRIGVRISELDERIGKLTAASDKIGSKTVGNYVGTPAIAPRAPRGDNFNPGPMVLGVVGTIFVGFPLALAFARLLWRRAGAGPAASPALAQEQARRFDRLEQSVDSIAIEIERISENQRYLTKLLAEPKQNASIAGGQ
jgi:hypothetical protein